MNVMSRAESALKDTKNELFIFPSHNEHIFRKIITLESLEYP
jgi:hypothetical protein